MHRAQTALSVAPRTHRGDLTKIATYLTPEKDLHLLLLLLLILVLRLRCFSFVSAGSYYAYLGSPGGQKKVLSRKA